MNNLNLNTVFLAPGTAVAELGSNNIQRRANNPPITLHALLLSLAALILPASATDWPQFLGPHRNGTIAETNLAPTWPKEGPPLLWQKKIGAGFAGPVATSGKVILFHRLDDKEIVACLDAKSGKELWQSSYPTAYRDDFGHDEGPRATPSVSSNRVFTFGAEGKLHCWALGTGAKLWSVDAQEKFNAGKGFFGIASSPLVEGHAVILNIGGRPGAGIVAFDAASGRVLWKANDDEASYASPVAATLGGRRTVLVLTRAGLVAAEPNSGRILFQYDFRPPMHASVSAATPLVIGDEIFLSASYGTGALLLRGKEGGAEKIWATDDALSNHYATSVPHQGFLYGFDGRQEQGCELRCVEWKTGKVRWRESGLVAGTLMAVNNELLVLTEKGQLLRAPAGPDGFKPTERAQILPFVARAHPALSDGLFFARSKDKLVCADLRPQRR